MEPTASDEREHFPRWDAARAVVGDADGQRAITALRRLGRHAVNALIVCVALLILLAPTLIFLVTLTWAAVSSVRSISLLIDLLHAQNFAALGPQLHELNIALRLALLSAGYFALVSALIVLYAGVLGRRWRRAMLIPGLLLTIPSALAMFLGAALTGMATGLAIQAQVVIFLYVLCDAIALGCLLADTRAPIRRVRRFLRPRRYFLWQRMPYYARRLQARYAVMREALSEPESALPTMGAAPVPLPLDAPDDTRRAPAPTSADAKPAEEATLAEDISDPNMPTVA